MSLKLWYTNFKFGVNRPNIAATHKHIENERFLALSIVISEKTLVRYYSYQKLFLEQNVIFSRKKILIMFLPFWNASNYLTIHRRVVKRLYWYNYVYGQYSISVPRIYVFMFLYNFGISRKFKRNVSSKLQEMPVTWSNI